MEGREKGTREKKEGGRARAESRKGWGGGGKKGWVDRRESEEGREKKSVKIKKDVEPQNRLK